MKHFNDTKKRIIIAGGSLGGLCMGIALQEQGINVQIYERSSGLMVSRGAGIVLQPQVIEFFERYGIAQLEEIGVPVSKRRSLSKNDQMQEYDMAQWMTSWDLLYSKLRHYFPAENYHSGYEVVDFEETTDDVIVHFKNGQKETCDILIGADGIGSVVRRKLLPAATPLYAGYVAWRGLVNENEASSELLDFFKDKFTFFQGMDTQILSYFIPESVEKKGLGRRLNWVWYVNVTDVEKLNRLMTDETGREHMYFMPPNSFNPQFIKKQKEEAKHLLPDMFHQLVQTTQTLFAQPIYDLSVPQMAFGKVCLTGDAAFVPRPHTAASTAKAVTNAMELASALENSRNMIDAIKKWESSQISLGKYITKMGIELGNRSKLGYYK